MKRLIGEMPSDTSPSTGAAEKVIYVRMEKSITFAATIEDSNWIRLKYDEEAFQIMKMASSRDLNVAQKESNSDQMEPDHKTDPSMLDKVNSKTEQYEKKLKAFHASEKQCNLSQSASISSSSEPKIVPGIIIPQSEYYKPPMEIFKEAIRNKDIEGLKKCLANTQSLYLTNTGGQMEFQELLPLLVSGPSVFFVTFQLHRSITDTYSVVYQLPSGELSNSYQSSLSVMETILQTLSSISAMNTYVYKGLQRKAVPLCPKVFIIGTHKDLLDKRSANANIESIDRCLQAVIKSTSHYREGVIQFASESQMIFTVNNHDPDDSDFQRIRTTFEKVVEKGDYRMRSPARWMIYSLVVRQLQNPIQSYNECYAIAKECGIRDKNEFDEVLHFIHTKMGLIRYFPYKELADIVIIDPQILFEKITELIVETFTFENVGKHAMETFRNKGIFSLSDFERISSQTGQSLAPKLFAQLLEHLRIAAPLNQDGVIKYFVPCALAHAEKKEIALLSSTTPSLLVIFQCGYCPKGIFGTLITYLIANEMRSSFEWEIIAERIYRDEATFQVGPYDIITIRFLPTHLEITLTASNPDLPREHCTVEEVCQEVHTSVDKGIKTVTSAINYINAKHSFAFYCTSESCKSVSHPAKLKKIKDKLCSLYCHKMDTCFPLPSGYEKWQLDTTEICYGLKKCHYPSLISQLSNCSAKWREIGTYLEFQQEELNIIENRPLLLSGAPKTWLFTLISEWMEWAPGDSRGSTKSANLKDLKSAVRKAGFGVVAARLSLKQETTAETGRSNISDDNKRKSTVTKEEPNSKKPRLAEYATLETLQTAVSKAGLGSTAADLTISELSSDHDMSHLSQVEMPDLRDLKSAVSQAGFGVIAELSHRQETAGANGSSKLIMDSEVNIQTNYYNNHLSAEKVNTPDFLDDVEDLYCDSSGLEHKIDEYDITVKIAVGSISEGRKIHLKVGASLNGPFKSSSGKRSISPIFWLCPEGEFELSKPIKVVLPHILTNVTTEDIENFGIQVAKATHEITPSDHHIDYVLKPLKVNKMKFESSASGNYVVIELTHCCFICLEAYKQEQMTPEVARTMAKKMGYCMHCIECFQSPYPCSPPKEIIYFCASFFLKKCIEAVEVQYPEKNNLGEIIRKVHPLQPFTMDGSSIELKYFTERTETSMVSVALPKGKKITASSVDFWESRLDIEEMKLMHNKMYPPSIELAVQLSTRVQSQQPVLSVSFEGCADENGVPQFQFILPIVSTRHLSGQQHSPALSCPVSPSNENGPAQLDEPLNEHHLCSIYRQLKEHSSKWRKIGYELGFRKGELDNIDATANKTVEDLLCAMLSAWLQWAPGDSRGSAKYATLRALRGAVDNAGLGRIAMTLTVTTETKYT